MTRSAFSSALRAFRRSKGWTVAELADRIGAGHSTVDAYLGGRGLPSPRRIARLVALGFVPPARQAPGVMRRAA